MLNVDNEGKVTFDGKEVLRKDINSSFLDSLFREALKNEIEFNIDETDPISKLFIRIKEETDPNSSFSKQIEALRSVAKGNFEEKNQIENAQAEDDLPF